MTNPEIGDPIVGLAQRTEKIEHDIQNIYGKLMRAFVGSRIVAGNITGVIPPGVIIGPTIVSLLNNSGGALADGDVVVLDIATTGRRIKTTTTAGDPHILGVVRDVNSVGPFANGSETPVQIDGYVATLNVTGAVAAGDFLRTSTTVKLAVSVGAVPARGIFARALTAAAGGIVEAEIYGADLAALAQIMTAKGDILVATAAGTPDNLPISGTDGFVLTEDSGDPFGVSWQAGGSGTPSATVEDETTFGITPDAGASSDYSRGDHTHGTPPTPTGFAVGTVLQNEFKGWPCLVAIGSGFDLVTQNQWFDDVGTPTTKASAVPVSGEAGLGAKFTEVIKCVTDAADEGWRNHRFTYADEPRVKSGVHLSALIWLGSTAGGVDCTAKLVNSDATETVGTVIATDGDWDLYYIEDHVCAGTFVDFQVTKDTSGTFYAGGRPTVMIGETGIELEPRHLAYRAVDSQALVDLIGDSATGAFVDIDCTSVSSNLAAMAQITLNLGKTSAGFTAIAFRRNGSSQAHDETTRLVQAEDANGEFGNNCVQMILDDAQIFEYDLIVTSGTVTFGKIAEIGYWEWE